LDIGYPGGVVIDRLAKTGRRDIIQFPRAMRDSLDFSFSGIKTSLLNMVKKRGCPYGADELPDVAAGYQEAIVEVLVEKTIKSARFFSVKQIVVCGGVASNSRLREKFFQESPLSGLEVFIPPPVLCTDNAAMIAVAGERLLNEGRKDYLNLNAISRWPLDLLNPCQS
jgi:N6-L-threonylcarbamoyladenine synthase